MGCPMNKLDFMRLPYNVKYDAVCQVSGECVIEKTKSSERDGRVIVHSDNEKVRTRHYSLITVKGKH